MSARRVFARCPAKVPGDALHGYRCRPDGAALGVEGAYWVVMFEGARLLRLSPRGSIDREISLPVRRATMPRFGGPDLKTFYITTAQNQRPPTELLAEPLAGWLLSLRVDVPSLPVNFLH